MKGRTFVLSSIFTLVISMFSLSYSSGLDVIFDIVTKEKKLHKKVAEEDIQIALESARRMNEIILEAIYQEGLANDKKISMSDIREINRYILNHYKSEWPNLHGDDENGVETGFHKIVNNGGKIKIFGKRAINKVFDGIYHIGFTIKHKRRLTNEDGNKNISIKNAARWLNALLKKDMENGSLFNPAIQEVRGETGTGLDKVIDIIYNDQRLQKRKATNDLREAARCANEMNKIIVEAVYATGAIDDGVITKDEIWEINDYIVQKYGNRWKELHGDDEEGVETGFHKVVKNGAKTRLFGKNAINKIFDGIYHLGFPSPYPRNLANEDGNKNINVKNAAKWLTRLLNM